MENREGRMRQLRAAVERLLAERDELLARIKLIDETMQEMEAERTRERRAKKASPAKQTDTADPPKWWQVYTNQEEKWFFVGKNGRSGLIRNMNYEWRSSETLAREAGLSKRRTEEIIAKYHRAGIVVQHPKHANRWGYWERVER